MQQTRLTAPLIGVRAGFGISVAVKGNTIVVGSNNDLGPTTSKRGVVNVYRRSGNNWTWQATLTPPGGGTPGDYGYAVAISDTEDRILATAPFDLAHDPYAGVAYSFAFDGATWSPMATIHAAPPFPPSTNDWFGANAAFIGEDYVVGAPFDGVGGAVYVGPTTETIFTDGFDEVP